MATESFEKHLYRKFKAVFVDGMSESAASDLNLLDILTKRDFERHGIRMRPHPVLEKAGSLADLGAASSEQTQAQLRHSLSLFEQRRGDSNQLISWSGVTSISRTFSSAKYLTASIHAQLLADAGVALSCAKNLEINVEGLETAKVNMDKLIDMIVDKHWKPDIKNKRLPWCDQKLKSNSKVKLWVIHEVLYASKLTIASGKSKSADVHLVQVVPATPGAGIGSSRVSGPNSYVVEAGTRSKFPGKFMFAYRALRFEFDNAGEYVEHILDAGPVQPIHRGSEDGPFDDERLQIEELFMQEPPEVFPDSEDEAGEDGEEWDGQPLPIHRGSEDGAFDDERLQIQELFMEEPPEVLSDSEDEAGEVDGEEWYYRAGESTKVGSTAWKDENYRDAVKDDILKLATNEGESTKDDYEIFKDEIYEDIKKIDCIQELAVDLVDTKTLLGSHEMLILSFFDVGKNSFEFYFKNREDMAYIVGVGLNYGKVILEGRKVLIREILEEDWDQRWKMVERGSSIRMKLLKLESPLSSLAIQGHTHLDVEISTEIPLLWKFAKYFTLRESIATFFTKDMYVKYTSGAGTSSSNSGNTGGGASSSNSHNDQGEKSIGGSFMYIPPEKLKHGEDENDEDQNDEIKEDKSNHLHEQGVVKATVSLQLLEGGDFINMVEGLEPLKETIYPKLKFEFINKNGDKRIRIVVGKTQFRLVWDKVSSEQSWYHQNLSIQYGLSEKHKCYGELGRSSYQHLDMKSGTLNTKVTSTHEDREGREGSMQGRISGNAYVVAVRGQLEGKLTSQEMNGLQEEHSVGTSLDVTEGGLFVKSYVNKHCIDCHYHFPSYKKDYDSCRHPRLNDHNLRFQGTWHPINKDGTSPASVEYTLCAKRGLRHISNKGKEHVQEYVNTMLVNHSMTHLDNKVYKLREGKDSRGKTILTIKRKTDLPQWGNEILLELVPLCDDNRSTNNSNAESSRRGNRQWWRRYFGGR